MVPIGGYSVSLKEHRENPDRLTATASS